MTSVMPDRKATMEEPTLPREQMCIRDRAVADVLERKDVDVRVQTAIEMKSIAEPYIRARAVRHLEKGRVVIFGCGTGNPFFSTDTGAVLRASEIDADMILLAKNVDGVYNADPAIDPTAVRFDEIDYDTVLAKHLEVMDFTATSLAMECQIPVMLFALKDPQNIVRAVMEMCIRDRSRAAPCWPGTWITAWTPVRWTPSISSSTPRRPRYRVISARPIGAVSYTHLFGTALPG